MKIGSAPCFQCNERYFGCHGGCSKYQAFRKERDEYNAEKVKRLDRYYNHYLTLTKSQRERVNRGKK